MPTPPTVHRFMAFILLSLATACAGDKRPNPSDYDQSCTANSDCVLVYNDCGGCACKAAGAINQRDNQRFVDDNTQAKCPPLTGSCLCDLPPECPVCAAGRCAVAVSADDAGVRNCTP
jgi:hypothetical protein